LKEPLLQLAGNQPDPSVRLNLVREYLQAVILRSLQEAGAFAAWAFQGGTALRFLYLLRRYSEELDFALELPERDRGFDGVMNAVRRDLHDSGFEVTLKVDTQRTVHTAMVGFPGLVEETGLGAVRRATLRVRVEVDTKPPAGAVMENRLVTRYFPLSLRVHDLGSCMAARFTRFLLGGMRKGGTFTI